MNFKHQKVTTKTPLPDGTTQIQSNSYYEKLAHQTVEIEKKVAVSKQTLLKEVMTCLEHLTKDKATEVNIKIKSYQGEPTKLIKRWTVRSESFDRQ